MKGTLSRNTNTSSHYKVDSNMNLVHNSERAEFFRVDVKDLAKMLNGTPEEKDNIILSLIQENQMLREDNEVVRTVAFKEQCRADKLERKLKKVVNN